jgi:hypothetical protein
LRDTIERRRGGKIRAKGIYRDPVESSRRFFVKIEGLCWLSFQLLTKPGCARRTWGLRRQVGCLGKLAPLTVRDQSPNSLLELFLHVPAFHATAEHEGGHSLRVRDPVLFHRLFGYHWLPEDLVAFALPGP